MKKSMEAHDKLKNEKNKYLFREKCFLCHKDNPNPLNISDDDDDNDDNNENGKDNNNEEIIRLFGLNPNKKLKKFPLWMCGTCKNNCENEENKKRLLKFLGKNVPETNLDFFNIEIKKPIVNFDGDEKKSVQTKKTLKPDLTIVDDVCSCKGCKDRRLIEEQEELHHTLIKNNWKELRHFIRCLYRQAGTGLIDSNSKEDFEKFKDHVRRLILYEAHKLYIQIQEEVKDYLNESNQRLLSQLRKSSNTQTDAYTFITLLLDEYESLCQAAKILSNILSDLEEEHLKRFHITWELDNKNSFRLIVYENELVQNSIPILFELLKDTNSKDDKSKGITSKIYSRFITFIEEMNVINAVWTECKLLLDKYELEQKTIFKLKEEMLKKDFEFYKICRKLIKEKLKSNDKLNEYLKREEIEEDEAKPINCTCDECTIKNLIICGILDTDFILNDDKKTTNTIEAAAAAVALAAATALNMSKSDEDDEDEDEEFDDDDISNSYESDEDELDSSDCDSDVNNNNSTDKRFFNNKKIDLNTLKKFKLCKNLYNLHLKFEKENGGIILSGNKKKFKQVDFPVSHKNEIDLSKKNESKAKTLKQSTKTVIQKNSTTTTTTTTRRLYHIYEAEITEEKKYILSENELIEAIKEYRLSQQHQQQHQQRDGNDDDHDCNSNSTNCCHCFSSSTIASASSTTTTTSSSTSSITTHSPTSSKIRERLKKKCFKKKEESKTNDLVIEEAARNRSVSSSSSSTNTTNTNKKNIVPSTLDIDTLVKYINGEDDISGKTTANSNNNNTKNSKKQKQKSKKKQSQQQETAESSSKKDEKVLITKTPVVQTKQKQQSEEQQVNLNEDLNKKNKNSNKKSKKNKKQNINGNQTNVKETNSNKENNNLNKVDLEVNTNNEEQFTLKTIEKIFMPRNDIENLNETEKEIEEFKRFCLECKPINQREKVKVNLNYIPIIKKQKQSLTSTTAAQITV